MSDITRIGTSARLSRAVVFGNLVFLSGQTTEDRSFDFRGQLKSTLQKIDGGLEEAGTDRTRILTAQIWMKDIVRDFAALNEIWTEWLPEGAAPTRATAQCGMGLPEILVEIIITAATK